MTPRKHNDGPQKCAPQLSTVPEPLGHLPAGGPAQAVFKLTIETSSKFELLDLLVALADIKIAHQKRSASCPYPNLPPPNI
jgi:hypothetical protein